MKNIRKICFLLVLMLISFTISCGDGGSPTAFVYEKNNPNIMEFGIGEGLQAIDINIGAVGDIMVHGPQIRAQYDQATNTYNFHNNFELIEPYLADMDLAIANLETTLAGEEAGYSGYPRFNSPDAIADALKDAGFHVISTANNHIMDRGKEGFIRTIEVLNSRGLDVIGSRKNIPEENFIIKDIKGVNVGLTAYTYETPMFSGRKTINGIVVPEDVEDLINTFSYEKLDEDLHKLEATVNKMKEAGAQLIVFCMHWGEEYQREPTPHQRYIANKLGGFGVDIILGSHPHVVQPIELQEIKGREAKIVVVYSLGNFLSNQRYEILNNRYTEDGIIVKIRIQKNLKEKALAIDQVSVIPTWVYRYFKQGKTMYEILPIMDALNRKEYYNLEDPQTLWRIKNSKENTLELIDSADVIINGLD